MEICTVPSEAPTEHLFRQLLGAYLGGAGEVIVRGDPDISPAGRDVVDTFCHRTRDSAIASERWGEVRLRLPFRNTGPPIPRLLGRMGESVVAFQRDAVASWTHFPLETEVYWERRDDDVDREAWYILRLSVIGGETDAPAGEALSAATVARGLERIADHAVILGQAGPRLSDLARGDTSVRILRQYHAQAMGHLESTLRANDPIAANDALDVGEALLSSGRALADRLLPAMGGGTGPLSRAAATARSLDSIGRTIAYAQDIAQVVLDRDPTHRPVPFADRPARIRLAAI